MDVRPQSQAVLHGHHQEQALPARLAPEVFAGRLQDRHVFQDRVRPVAPGALVQQHGARRPDQFPVDGDEHVLQKSAVAQGLREARPSRPLRAALQRAPEPGNACRIVAEVYRVTSGKAASVKPQKCS